MGAVYLAYDTALHRPVAIKVIDDPAKSAASHERALEEARSASALSHPNICTVFEVGEAQGAPFIAMEYVDGQSVLDRLNGGPLPVDEALRYGLQAADALAHAHERGVVHRDIKAANAIVAGSGWLKIVDFGLARRDDSTRSDATTLEAVVPAGVAAGTPYSMAPEQVRGAAVGPPADVWGLGVLLYEMVEGARPFAAATNAELFAAVLRDQPRPLAETIPGNVDSLIRSCLSKEPAARSTAHAVRDGIRTILTGKTEFRAGPGRVQASAGSARRRLLVLPFANISADPDTDYFADGLTEELIADLSRVDSLMVISRTSATKLKGHTDDIRALAERLGVELVLDGSVRKSKHSLRITVQLIDAAIDSPIWSDKFTAGDEDLFDVQERLSRQIIDAMKLTLTRTEAERLGRRHITDPRVYDIYLRARHKLGRFSARDLDDAVSLLRSGLEILADNALLLATLGHAYVMFVHWGVRPDPKYLDLAQACADQILLANPGSTEAHGLQGGIQIKRGHLQDAVHHLKEAIRADPGNTEATAWLAYAYMTAGHPQSARPLIDQLLKVDPLTALTHVFDGWTYVIAGKPDEALPRYRRGYDLDPGSPLMKYLWGFALTRAGHTAEGAAHFRHVAETIGESVFGDLAGAFAHALTGDAAAARAAIRPATAAAARSDEALARFLAQLHALIDDGEGTCEWLERALAAGNLDYPTLARDPTFRHVRSMPRFQQLLEETRQRWEAFEV